MHELNKDFGFVLGAFEVQEPELDCSNIFAIAAANPSTTARPVAGLQLGL